MLQVLLGLGANLGDPPTTFVAALSGLTNGGRVLAVSRLWLTRPQGPAQPAYHNAAAVIAWPRGPHRLLETCRRLEAAAGRDRATERHWGPRTLDLDLLAVRDLVTRGPELELPHPRLHERVFALVPAAEVAPDWVHPLIGRTLAALAEEAAAADPGALISCEPFPDGLATDRR